VPIVTAGGLILGAIDLDACVRGGTGMLAVYLPYAVLVLAALACYGLLGWRHRFLASALILGPFTLARPAVAIAGAVAGAWNSPILIAVLCLTSTAAVLAVEPIANRRWYADLRPPPVA
jgi:hypothetical protein